MGYLDSHPWINFKVDTDSLPYRAWVRLGEAQSKCEHLSGVPLLPQSATELHAIYLAKGVSATTAIEGNTLTEEEVRKKIEGALQLPPSKEYLGQEVQNIIDACGAILEDVMSSAEPIITVEKVKEFNRLVLRSLPPEEDVIPGEIRKHSVVVGPYLAPPANDCEFLLQRFCDWLNHEVVLPTDDRILFGILKAIVAHVYFAWIHPFGNGNGRTARLIEFQILLSSGVPSAAAHLLSNHYNLTRTEYYRQLDATSKTGGNLSDFILYAVQGLVDGLREQLNVVRDQQLRVHWNDYIYRQFSDLDTAVGRRQRRLILDLTNATQPMPLSEVRYVSPRVAEAYSNRSDKTLQRDLNELIQMGLVRRTPDDYYVANITRMLAFLPVTRSVGEERKPRRRRAR